MKRSAQVCLNSDWGKQGKLLGHSKQCYYRGDLVITDRGQDFQKQLIGLLASLDARWAEPVLGRCERQWSTKEPHASPARLNQCPKAALKHLTHLLSDQTPEDKLGNFDLDKRRSSICCWVSWAASLGISTLSPFVPRQAHRGQRMKMPHVSFKISGWLELTKTGGEHRDLRSRAWKTRLKDSCSSQMLLGNQIVKYCQFLGSA